jgi:hypothetical protein
MTGLWVSKWAGISNDFWQLEEHRLGEQSFTHFADGTAHKNRMQGNDYVTSIMYTHGSLTSVVTMSTAPGTMPTF